MAKDCLGAEVYPGDMLVLNPIYYVKELCAEPNKIILDVSDSSYLCNNFIKINNNYGKMAEDIIQLINAKPWSPTKEELISILKGTINDRTNTNKK